MPGMCGCITCVPKTCSGQGLDCGLVSTGCGNAVYCGACPAGETCGGGGNPNVCGGDCGCCPQNCEQQGFNCDVQGDGCGGILDCGTCTAPETCGGGGTLGVCGTLDGGLDACAPTDCAQQGLNCGLVSDGCGNVLDCGDCPQGKTCGGGGQPYVCGP